MPKTETPAVDPYREIIDGNSPESAATMLGQMCRNRDDLLRVLRLQVKRLLDQVAAEQRPCRLCKEPLWMVKHKKSGKTAPYTREAVNHFANCPNADQFRGGRT